LCDPLGGLFYMEVNMGRKLAVIAAVLYWPHLALAVTRDWVNPQPTRERLYAVCAARYDCVFAVGDGGTIIHWNGQRWQEMESGTGLRLYDVWGSSGTDVWAVGGQGPYEGAPPDSLLLHYDGQRWSRQAIGAREALRAVWGAGPNCAVAVGPESVIFRWDGQQWTTLAAPEGDRLHFTDVWCSGPDDIWPVDTRVLYHWNGVNWERAETGASRGVDKVCGVSPAEVYCAGPRCVARFDGQTWTAITPPDLYYDEDVDAMWASGPDSLFVAINDFGNLMSRLCHWDGSVWSVAGELSLIDSHQKVLGVSGTGPRNVFCVGESGAL